MKSSRRSSSVIVSALFRFGLISTVLLFGCKDKSGGISSSRQAHKPLIVFTYPEYLAPEALDLFEQDSGIEVDCQVFETVDEMRALIESNPGYHDVIIADEGKCHELAELRLIRKLEFGQLESKKQLDPEYWTTAKQHSNPFFIPYLRGSTIVAFRSDKIALQPADRSWALFWHPKVRGKAALSDEPTDLFAAVQAKNGFPLHSREREHRRIAIEDLRRAIIGNGVRLGDSWSNLVRLSKGELWVAHCYSGDAAFFAAENDDIEYFMPSEGAEIWLDGFMIARDSNRVDEAHRFIDFILRPEISAICANFAWYMTPNLAAKDMLDPDLLADEVLNHSDEMKKKCSIVPKLDAESLKNLQYGMREVHAAVREAELTESAPAPSQPASSLLPVQGADD